MLPHSRVKTDLLVGIQDIVPKISYFTPENRKTLKNLEATAQVLDEDRADFFNISQQEARA